ncbi:hypothetical protein NMG60_11018948 [Bertholletia excelsa]
MEIPELSIISDIEAGVSYLQNPSLISRVFSLSGIQQVPQVYIFWKWGALILALVATFSGVITFWTVKCLASSGPPTQQILDDYSSDEDKDEDEDEDEDISCSSKSSDHERYNPTTSFHDREQVDEVYCVAGSRFRRDYQDGDLRLRRLRSAGDRFSWSDFAGGRSPVKLWNSVGLALNFEEDSLNSMISLWDMNRDKKITSFSGMGCQIPVVSSSSPTVIISAGSNREKSILLGVYDTREKHQAPAVVAEWRPRRQGKVVVGAVSGGVEKVYVSDSVAGDSLVGDLRKITSPLEYLAESDGDKW